MKVEFHISAGNKLPTPCWLGVTLEPNFFFYNVLAIQLSGKQIRCVLA